MNNVQTYVLGNGNMPQWVNEEAIQGRIQATYDDDGNIINAKVISGMKKYVANIGDTILKSKTGMVVIPKEKAKKYRLQPTIKVEEKKEKETKEE